MQLQSPRSAQECSADLWCRRSFCCHFGRRKRCDLGRTKLWWWQLQSPKSAPECSADFCHRLGFCCHLGRWKRSDVGWSSLRRWQLRSSRSAQECSAYFCRRLCFCCNLGRWRCCDMGQSPLWWWQLQSARSAPECPADCCTKGFEGAFAAILADGSVVTWGEPNYGGDSSRVQNQLRNVQQISATDSAFAAILAGGSVVTWGDRWRWQLQIYGTSGTSKPKLWRWQLQSPRSAHVPLVARVSMPRPKWTCLASCFAFVWGGPSKPHILPVLILLSGLYLTGRLQWAR